MKYLIDSYQLMIIKEFAQLGVNPKDLRFESRYTRFLGFKSKYYEVAHVINSDYILVYYDENWGVNIKTIPNVFDGVSHIGVKSFDAKLDKAIVSNCIIAWAKSVANELHAKNSVASIFNGSSFNDAYYDESYFTEDELVEINLRITALTEHFTTLSLPENQLSELIKVINELRKDAKRFNKKDFLIYVLGIITNLIISYGFSGQHSQLIWEAIKLFLLNPHKVLN